MQLPDWIARRPLPMALLACALAGLLLGWLATPLPRHASAAHGEAPWVVPGAASLRRYDDKAFQVLLTSAAWADRRHAGQPGGGPGGGDAPAWSLVGIVLTPQPAALVLDTASAKVTRLAPGAALPDGSTLEKIERDGIKLSRHGCSIRIRLFHPSHDAGAEHCSTPAGTGGGTPHTGEHE
ncbi:MAG: hypothetical protein KGJ32_10745 [Xanthomonadaceae bacterium]|nr:hypothetical protein [Xanthomonadaceae bacterium]